MATFRAVIERVEVSRETIEFEGDNIANAGVMALAYAGETRRAPRGLRIVKPFDQYDNASTDYTVLSIQQK